MSSKIAVTRAALVLFISIFSCSSSHLKSPLSKQPNSHWFSEMKLGLGLEGFLPIYVSSSTCKVTEMAKSPKEQMTLHSASFPWSMQLSLWVFGLLGTTLQTPLSLVSFSLSGLSPSLSQLWCKPVSIILRNIHSFGKHNCVTPKTAISALVLVSCTPSPSLSIPLKACQLGDQRVCEDIPVQSRSFNQVQSPVYAVTNEENILTWQNGVETPLIAKKAQRRLF